MKKIVYLLLLLSLVSCSEEEKKEFDGNHSGNKGDYGENTADSKISAISFFLTGTEDGHDFVDLGLPSGTLWATANIGASESQAYGNYFAWGETEPQASNAYSWGSYKYAKGISYENPRLIKYCNNSEYGDEGFIDNKTVLDLEDDVAHVNWGGKWRMPTKEQCDELMNEGYWVWTDNYNGSYRRGFIVYKAKEDIDKGSVISYSGDAMDYSLSDIHIFLPAAGQRFIGSISSVNSTGSYLSSSLVTGSPYNAWHISFSSTSVVSYSYYIDRSRGYSVRPVISGE